MVRVCTPSDPRSQDPNGPNFKPPFLRNTLATTKFYPKLNVGLYPGPSCDPRHAFCVNVPAIQHLLHAHRESQHCGHFRRIYPISVSPLPNYSDLSGMLCGGVGCCSVWSDGTACVQSEQCGPGDRSGGPGVSVAGALSYGGHGRAGGGGR